MEGQIFDFQLLLELLIILGKTLKMGVILLGIKSL